MTFFTLLIVCSSVSQEELKHLKNLNNNKNYFFTPNITFKKCENIDLRKTSRKIQICFQNSCHITVLQYLFQSVRWIENATKLLCCVCTNLIQFVRISLKNCLYELTHDTHYGIRI